MRLRLSIEIFILLAFTDFVFIWNLVSFETPGPSDAQATSAYSALILPEVSKCENLFTGTYNEMNGGF